MKNKILTFGLIAIISIVFISGCVQEETIPIDEELPTPPTIPASIGYIRSYDHKLGYGFEYPEDWEMHSPEEFTLGGGIEKVEMFTKKGEGTSITLIVKSTNWKSLEEVKEQYGKIDPLKTTLKEDIIEVNDRKGYEIIYRSPPMKTREVVFLANGRAYTLKYSTTEDLYVASEEIFDHVINSFIIE